MVIAIAVEQIKLDTFGALVQTTSGFSHNKLEPRKQAFSLSCPFTYACMRRKNHSYNFIIVLQLY